MRTAARTAEGGPADVAALAACPLPELLSQFKSRDTGLTTEEAAAALDAAGPNRVAAGVRKTLLADLGRRLLDPLVLILLFAATVSGFTGDLPSFAIITAIVLMSVVLDVSQERHAQNAAEKLRADVALSARVLRDGQIVEVGAENIAPGDVVLLSAGDLAPADARLIESRDLYVDEALLTGEAYPAEKEAATLTAESARASAFPRNMVFMGSSVVSGTARALVTATGPKAQVGAIAKALQRPEPPSAFSIGVRRFGMMIIRVTVLLVLFVVLVNLLFHRPLLQSFLFAVALAVGLTPELLPMIVSITLAQGAIRMARKAVIVKRQSAIDDLGAMDVFCSDKTGTLTEARIRLIREIDLHGRDSRNVMKLAQLNAAFETGLKSPLDDAILAAVDIDRSAWRKIDEAPFDFQRRRVSILVEGENRRLLIVKGAPEDVLRNSSRYEQTPDDPRPLDDGARRAAQKTFEALGEDGFRVLGVAWREVEAEREHAGVADETELIFAGFLAFLDPPKADARQALSDLAGLGVAVKVVTGDNEQVTRHVCAELDLRVDGVLTGPQIADLTDEALLARVEDVTLFCRVTPPQKSRIISALRRKGHTVGYMGDGINDAPPLHAADVGFSVESAVDVAKEAACMILLRKDLSVLADGVREGRRTFVNILKYMMMGVSSNFGNMFSMAGGVLFLPFLPMQPVQILLNNLLYDLSETAIPIDRVADFELQRPRRWDLATLRRFMIVFGLVSSLFDFFSFFVLLKIFRADEALFQTGWFVESLSTQILVIFILRSTQPWRDRPHPALVATSLSALAAAVALPYLAVGRWLGFVPLPPALLATIGLIAAVYLALVLALKHRFFDRSF